MVWGSRLFVFLRCGKWRRKRRRRRKGRGKEIRVWGRDAEWVKDRRGQPHARASSSIFFLSLLPPFSIPCPCFAAFVRRISRPILVIYTQRWITMNGLACYSLAIYKSFRMLLVTIRGDEISREMEMGNEEMEHGEGNLLLKIFVRCLKWSVEHVVNFKIMSHVAH